MSSEMELSGLAYVKMVLHGVRWPGEAVVGVLLGRRRGAVWSLEEAVGLSHGPGGLATPLEAGLLQTEAWASARSPPLSVLGVYHGAAHLSDVTRPGLVTRLGERVAGAAGDAVLLTLEGALLGAAAAEPCYSVYRWSAESRAFAPAPKDSLRLAGEEAALRLTNAALQARLHRDLADFALHLDAPAQDFTNQPLNHKIHALR